jgi:hypothetical protein
MVTPSRGRQLVEDVPLVVLHGLAKTTPARVEVGPDERCRRPYFDAGQLSRSTPGELIEIPRGLSGAPGPNNRT